MILICHEYHVNNNSRGLVLLTSGVGVRANTLGVLFKVEFILDKYLNYSYYYYYIIGRHLEARQVFLVMQQIFQK